jgi:predicted nucleotidyltransferase
MIDLEAKQLLTVQQLLREYLPNYPVFAFGSRTHGKSKKFSDLDLMIRAPQSPTSDQLGRAREAFEDSDLPIMVDLIDWNSCSTTFQTIIEPQLEPLAI